MSRFIYCYAECRYAECHYAECNYAECCYAECCYAECRYAECRTAHFHILKKDELYVLISLSVKKLT